MYTGVSLPIASKIARRSPSLSTTKEAGFTPCAKGPSLGRL